MLAPAQIELLTAYVDGELSPRDRHVVMRLINESSEARQVLMQLQENAHRIQQLPRHTLDAVFTAEVVQAVSRQPMEAARPRRPIALSLRWLPYAAAGVAAAVLVVVAAGGVLYGALGLNWFGADNPDNAIVKGEEKEEKPAPPVEDGDKLPSPKRTPNPLPGKIVEGVLVQFAAPMPPERAVAMTFQELSEKEQAAKRLAAEIKKNEKLQLDIVVRNNPQAIDRLKSALKPLGVKLAIDPSSEAALTKGGKAEFLIYAENLKADELTNLLKQLAAEEKKTASPYDKMKVSPLSKEERQTLVAFLGEELDQREKANTQGNIDPKRPKPNPKAERVVVVLPQQANAKQHSEEMKQFLYQPAYPQPGSVRVLLRIRQE
jgi:hypothetical protein